MKIERDNLLLNAGKAKAHQDGGLKTGTFSHNAFCDDIRYLQAPYMGE